MLTRIRVPSIVIVRIVVCSPEMIRSDSPLLREIINLPSAIRNLLVKSTRPRPIPNEGSVFPESRSGWFVIENRICESLEKMVDEGSRALVVYCVLKFCVRCVGALRMIDHPDQKVSNIFNVIFF